MSEVQDLNTPSSKHDTPRMLKEKGRTQSLEEQKETANSIRKMYSFYHHQQYFPIKPLQILEMGTCLTYLTPIIHPL